MPGLDQARLQPLTQADGTFTQFVGGQLQQRFGIADDDAQAVHGRAQAGPTDLGAAGALPPGVHCRANVHLSECTRAARAPAEPACLHARPCIDFG
jgi:hypothetical protein